jgi:hypothetical protein
VFRILRLVLAAILIAAFAGVTSAGDGGEWSIVQSSGGIWVQVGGAERVSLGDTRTVLPGTTLATSATGRILLQRGRETMVVGPGTVMNVPADSSRAFTTVIELMGEIDFDVEKRSGKHFEVRTPYLAAVVKGTRFSVRASAEGDSVAVERGVVEVEALGTGEKVDLLPGQSAFVSSAGLAVETTRHAGLRQGAAKTASASPASDVDGGGINASVGGSDGLSVSVGGGNGISASLGGSDGVGVNIGGGNGVSVNVGGLGIGLGGQ